MLKQSLYKLVTISIIILTAIIALSHFTGGYIILTIVVASIYFALRGKSGLALLGYLLTNFLVSLNPYVFHKGVLFSKITRFAMLAILLSVVIGGCKRNGNERLPINYIFIYLIFAIISSIQGYFPLISYLKIVSFSAFIIGLFVATKSINFFQDELLFFRAGLLSISAIVIWGSLLALPFPVVSYYTSIVGYINSQGIEVARDAAQELEGNGLFSGLTGQSQYLGPLLACLAGWIACDMLFVERKVDKLHLFLLIPIPVMIAMTKSRIGILTFCMVIIILLLYCMPRIKVPDEERVKIKNLIIIFAALIVIASTIAEIRNHSISKLVRKTSEVGDDQRSLTQAVTESRQGKIHECLHDFRTNPLWGTGFQVIKEHPYMYRNGEISLYSAPIEKGILPIMVLGEGGIVGSIAMVIFLYLFFNDANKHGYTATITLFSTLLVTNMAEATFFSPGGGGGVLWIITVGGGFAVDMSMKTSNEDAILGTLPKNPNRRTRLSLNSIIKKKNINNSNHTRGSGGGWFK